MLTHHWWVITNDVSPMTHNRCLTVYLHWYSLVFRLNKDKYFPFDLRPRAETSFICDGWKYEWNESKSHLNIAEFQLSRMKRAWVEEFGSHWITIIEALSLNGFKIVKILSNPRDMRPFLILNDSYPSYESPSYGSFVIYFLKRSFVVILCCHINNLKLTSSESDGNSESVKCCRPLTYLQRWG